MTSWRKETPPKAGKAQLRYEQRKATEGPFGSSTPSSQIPVEPNSSRDEEEKRGGAKVGHQGHGRQAVGVEEADRVEVVEGENNCPCCGGPLQDKGVRPRTVVDGHPLKKETIIYRLRRQWCPHCRKSFQARAPGVLPKSLYGNQLLTHVAVQHYVYDVPLGRLEEQLGIGYGSLLAPLHRLAGLLGPVIHRLVEEYRQSPVKHADETSWRTDGHNGYAWLFCTSRTSLFRFRGTRSASVAREVFGEKPLPGALVVDHAERVAITKLPAISSTVTPTSSGKSKT